MDELLYIAESYSEHPSGDVGISHALLEATAAGAIGPVFRLHVSSRVLAFGMADRIQPGYQDAIRVAVAHGYTPVERLAGGRAAVFHRETLVFSWATPQIEPRTGIKERFEFVSNLFNATFLGLGLDTRVGEVPGEYCPGEYSINLGGRTKVMGVGQRLVKGAAHVGGVIVVDGSDAIRDVLIPVYRALRIDWDPRTTGALADRSPGLDTSTVRTAIHAQLDQTFKLSEMDVPDSIRHRGGQLAGRHTPRIAL